MSRPGNSRTAKARPRVVTVKLPCGKIERASSGRYIFTHVVIAQKGKTNEAGYLARTWHAKSWHESKVRAEAMAESIRREQRREWIGGVPHAREQRWAEVRVVPVKVERDQPWAKKKAKS